MEFFQDHPGRIFLVAATIPLAVALVMFLGGTIQRLRRAEPGPGAILAGWLAVFAMAVSAACSIVGTSWLFHDLESLGPANMHARWSEDFDYLQIGSARSDHRPSLTINLGYTANRLTALMMCMVTIIGTLIFLFSLGYMKDELKQVHDHQAHVHRRGRFARFFFYLLLFAFSMLQLIIADNLLQVFVCWELVGVSSFLLIGFYYERKSASTAANKAFIMNRIGDAGFLIGLAILFTQLGTFNFHDLENAFRIQDHAGLSNTLWIAMGLGLFAGCVGKSAQVPLQTWLPDAMEGPTPVSALIHAATMVAAGVYLCARCLPFFAPEVLATIAWIGAITLFLSAATATVQNDIKRVLAFSTCSQLGYMMLALGLIGWNEGLFHLLTHAFFKALLFLGAGSVIHALHHEQDLLKMGGLRKKLPVTAFTMLIGVAAIVGLPLLSGWYSKDAILAKVYIHAIEHKSWIFAILAFGTVILTAYYMTRLWLLAFAGKPRDEHVYNHAHESPFIMLLPLLVLSVFSIGVAWGWPVWDAHASVLGKVLHEGSPTIEHTAIAPPPPSSEDEKHHFTQQVELLGLFCASLGVMFALAWPNRQPRTSFFTNMLRERFYFDSIYLWAFTKPTLLVSCLTGRFDKQKQPGLHDFTLDGTFTSLGSLVGGTGKQLAPLQSGSIRAYVLALGLTVTGGLAILWMLR